MLIKGFQPLTMIDYPNKIAATVFLFGCNFRCPYCHNPELVYAEEAKKTKTYSEQEILKLLHERKGFVEGVCITGGEPILNAELPQLIEKIREMGFKIKLDTNGTNPEMLKQLVEKKLVDYIAMDIKAPLDKYEKVVNSKIDINAVKKSIEIIKKFHDYEFRTTIVPGLLDKKDLLNIGKLLRGSKAFYLQEFRPVHCLDKNYEKKTPYHLEKMQEFKEMLKPYFKKVEFRMEV